MSTLLLITIIVVAVVTCLVIGLTLLAYSTVLKSAKRLASTGVLDEEFLRDEAASKHPIKKVFGIILHALSILLCVGLVSLAVVAGVYKAKGEQFVYNDHVSLVIASDSMKEYWDDDYKEELIGEYSVFAGVSAEESDKKLFSEQFEKGDLLDFKVVEAEEELNLYDVYGYKNKKNQIITHRLIGVATDGSLVFRGDNTGGRDTLVSREQVVYRYEGQKVKGLGIPVLFFGSGFGIYSIISVLAMYTISDIAIYKYNKIKKDRLEAIKEYHYGGR